MRMLTKLYDILLANGVICSENLFMDNQDVCQRITVMTFDNTTYSVFIVNDEVKEIIEL